VVQPGTENVIEIPPSRSKTVFTLLWNVDSVVCVCLVLLNPKNHDVFKIKMMILIYFYVWNGGSDGYSIPV
jgi:hypothetical protein